MSSSTLPRLIELKGAPKNHPHRNCSKVKTLSSSRKRSRARRMAGLSSGTGTRAFTAWYLPTPSKDENLFPCVAGALYLAAVPKPSPNSGTRERNPGDDIPVALIEVEAELYEEQGSKAPGDPADTL